MINTALMVSAHNEMHLNKLQHMPCDIVIINLEDGVFDKNKARQLLKTKYKQTTLQLKNKIVVVRVNSLDTCGKKDIKVINKLKPDAIRIPKIKTKKDIKKALKLCDKSIDIHLSIETKEAFNNLHKFGFDKRITTVYLGILDLFESFGLPQELIRRDNPTVDYILSKFLINSKVASLHPISFMYQDYNNVKEFKKWCKKENKIGFTTKACLGPKQLEIANNIFKNKKSDIKDAKNIIKLFKNENKKGKSGFMHKKYGFIDEPIYKNALLLLKLNKS